MYSLLKFLWYGLVASFSSFFFSTSFFLLLFSIFLLLPEEDLMSKVLVCLYHRLSSFGEYSFLVLFLIIHYFSNKKSIMMCELAMKLLVYSGNDIFHVCLISGWPKKWRKGGCCWTHDGVTDRTPTSAFKVSLSLP